MNMTNISVNLAEAASCTTLVEAVWAHAHASASNNLISCRGANPVQVTYRQLWQLSSAGKAGLRGAGIRPGDRVALVMDSSIDVIALILAVQRAGATLIPVQPINRLNGQSETARRILAIVRASNVDLFVSARSTAPAWSEILQDAATRVAAAEEVLASAADEEGIPECYPEDQLALIQFSSGSTGTPKGVCLSHANIAFNLAAISERLGWSASDRVVCWLPFYHDLGLIGVLQAALWNGCSATFYAPGDFVRNPLGWLRCATEEGATMTAAPQFAYNLCADKAQIANGSLPGIELSAMRLMLNGSEFIHWESCTRFERLFAPYGLRAHVLQPAYGMAENCVGVSLRPPGTPAPLRMLARHGGLPDRASDDAPTVSLIGNGAPVRGTEVAIFDQSGVVLPAGCLGHIHIRGDSTTRNYMSGDGTLIPAQHNGWLDTGDIGALIDGEIFVAGRSKEIFKRGGRTFSPPDIEQSVALATGLEAGSVAAFAFYEPTGGTEKLFLIIEQKRAALADPPLHLVESVGKHTLRNFQFRADAIFLTQKGQLPRTSSGKIRRVLLAELASRGELASALPLVRL